MYHIALCKGGKYHGGRTSTVIVQARKNLDLLSCEAWQYLGQRNVTKVQLIAQKAELLAAINTQYNTNFQHILIS